MTRFTVHRYDDPAAFERDVQAFLMENEAANGLPLGLLSGLQAGEWERPYLATVVSAEAGADRGSLALVVMRTPPHNLVLCEPVRLEALNALVDDLSDAGGALGLPGVLGPADAASAFAELWAERHGVRARLAVSQRIYRCANVDRPAEVAGRLRPVTRTDRPLVVEWLNAFHGEALPGEPFDAETAVDRWLGSPLRALYLWEVEGQPVAMAGAAGPTPNGVRVVAVYTPVERRRRGYASAAVAELTQRLLDEGREFCTLYTDLSNPTSNEIYQRIGYRPVIDFPLFRFESPDA